MSPAGLVFVIGLPVLACAFVIIAELNGHLVRTLPVPPRLDAYDIDAIHRADLIERYSAAPPSEGELS